LKLKQLVREVFMFSFGKGLLLSVFAIALSGPVLAQPKADAGSGPTSGAGSANDAGSGPTTGAKPNSNATGTGNSADSTENSAGVTPGPKSTGGSQPTTPATPDKK
jgi:hypothetical protein